MFPLFTEVLNPDLQERPQLILANTSTPSQPASKKMKAIFGLMLAPLVAAKVAMKHGMDLDSREAPFITNSTGASCGIGYTYCGYILEQQKSIFTYFPVYEQSLMLDYRL